MNKSVYCETLCDALWLLSDFCDTTKMVITQNSLSIHKVSQRKFYILLYNTRGAL